MREQEKVRDMHSKGEDNRNSIPWPWVSIFHYEKTSYPVHCFSEQSQVLSYSSPLPTLTSLVSLRSIRER